jgi:hypothetical protein
MQKLAEKYRKSTSEKIAIMWSERYEDGKHLFVERGTLDYKVDNVND